MENENKNNNQPHHKKKRHHKPKGYFIDPKAKPEDGAQAPAAEGKQVANQSNRQEHHNKKPNENTNPQKANKEQNASSAPQSAGGNPNQKKHNKQGGHKNHHNNNNGNKGNHPQQSAQKDASQQHKANHPQKKQDAPREEIAVPAFNADDYEEVRFPAASVSDVSEAVDSDEPVKMVEVVGIRFKSSGKVYYFLPNGKTLHRGQHAIVETSRGQEYGEVAMGNKEVKETDTVPPLRSIIRIATEADTAHHKDNKAKEAADDIFTIVHSEKLSAKRKPDIAKIYFEN